MILKDKNTVDDNEEELPTGMRIIPGEDLSTQEAFDERKRQRLAKEQREKTKKENEENKLKNIRQQWLEQLDALRPFLIHPITRLTDNGS